MARNATKQALKKVSPTNPFGSDVTGDQCNSTRRALSYVGCPPVARLMRVMSTHRLCDASASIDG